MKKMVSALLVALLLCGLGLVGASATLYLPQAMPLNSVILPSMEWEIADHVAQLEALLLEFKDGQVTGTRLLRVAQQLIIMDMHGIDYSGTFEWARSFLPMNVKAALHDAGLASFPIWERDPLMHFIFYWILFGWLWM